MKEPLHHEGDPADEPCVFIASKAADGNPGLSESPRQVLRFSQVELARSAVKVSPRLPGSFLRCEGTATIEREGARRGP